MLSVKEISKKAGLVILSILLSFFSAEIILRFIYLQQAKYFVWQPNLKHTFYPDSTIFYGIGGAKQFSINSCGFRGEEFKGGGIKFLCLGGSTTECLYLDDKETWTHLLEDSLNAKFKTWKFQIGSIGKSGCTTRENYIQLKYYVPQLGKIDGVIMMVGLNDMMKRLSRDTLFENEFRFTPQVEDSFVHAIFQTNDFSKETKFYRKTILFELAQSLYHKIYPVDMAEMQQNETGDIYKTWRANRAHPLFLIDSLPNLTSALDEYERNLNLIYAETQKQGVKLILVNQSALYKDTMSNFESNLLWMVGVGNFQKESNHPYYSTKALKHALELYNQRLQVFCNSKRYVKLVDLASQLPRDTSVFYDDCHFNESGARKVAGIISRQIMQ